MAGVARQAYGLIKPFVNPQGIASDFVANLVGDQAGAVNARLKGAQQLVPGSTPTAAQVAGSTPLVQAEKALANQSPDFKGALVNRGVANNAARLNAIQQVAGTPETLAAAQ